MDVGIYTGKEGDRDFGEMLALVVAGDARLLGESYDEHARKHVLIEVGKKLSPNSSEEEVGFELGELWFSNVLRDYQNNFGEKWWREAIQNAVDAGAKNVSCTVEPDAEGNMVVSVSDDGRGMSQEVLVGAFLRGGGTTKQEGSSTFGGFGRAKELLILPWVRYEIHTRDLLVASRQAQKAPLQRVPERKGTRLSVTMPASKYAKPEEAIAYIAKCDLPGIRFTVNGEKVAASLGRRTQPIRERVYVNQRDDGSEGRFTVKIYFDEKNTNYPWDALVRLNGLFMFDQWISSKPKGLVLVEIEGAAKDVLMSNRDGFAAREVKRDLDDFAQEVSRERESALRKKQGLIREKYTGRGKFQASVDIEEKRRTASEREAALLERANGLQPTKSGHIDGASLKEIMQALSGYHEAEGGEDQLVTFASSEVADAILNSMVLSGADDIEVVAKQLAWSPDYYLVNDIEGMKVKSKFKPETMTTQVRTLLGVWAELCRMVLCLLGCGRPFGVGFVFSNHSLAEYRKEDGEEWLMLNPMPGLTKYQDDPPLIDLSDKAQLMQTFASAVHEVTHMANRCSEHDKDFAAALTFNIAKTYGKDKEIKQILAAVRKREKEAPKPARSPARPATKPLPSLSKWRIRFNGRFSSLKFGRTRSVLFVDGDYNERVEVLISLREGGQALVSVLLDDNISSARPDMKELTGSQMFAYAETSKALVSLVDYLSEDELREWIVAHKGSFMSSVATMAEVSARWASARGEAGPDWTDFSI